MKKVCTVYEGRKNGELVYIGATIQKPKDRFRWHKYNGKNLDFKILYQFNDIKQMLDKEFELIQKYKPALNKITKRKQNLNVKLSESELEARKSDPQWCGKCLKRRVNRGYKFCIRCS